MRTALLLAALALGALPAAAQELWPDLSQPPQEALGGGEKDAALIVGAENYFKVEPVAGARQNAADWQAYLTETLKVPIERTTFLRDEQATLEKMRKYSALAAAKVEPGGTLWFVFIGHGLPSKDGQDGLLAGIDAQQDADSLYARSLPRSELLDILAKGKQDRTVVILDACFSGKSASGQELAPGLQGLVNVITRPAGGDARTVLMTAAASDQFAGPLPFSPRRRPAFSYLVLGALRGWAADASGTVTAGAAVHFAEKALGLAQDRTQTPELAAGAATAVLGKGKEATPDLKRIAREGATASSSRFQVTNLPAVPTAEAPKALDATADSAIDFRRVNIALLKRKSQVAKLDKSDAPPQDKAEAWRELAKGVPDFADKAEERAAQWDRFCEQKQAGIEVQRLRAQARDADWEQLAELLTLDEAVVPQAEKGQWAQEFLRAYLDSPGLEPAMAKELVVFSSTGAAREGLEKLAQAAPKDAAVAAETDAERAARANARKAGLEWVAMPAGSFSMGSDSGDVDEKPVHAVTVKAFSLARAPVTFKQYKACVEAGACTSAHTADGNCFLYDGANWNPGVLPPEFQRDEQPVVCVDWQQAQAFSAWVGGRLPTEAEWEYAARSAGKAWAYPWGSAKASCDRSIVNDPASGGLGCGRKAAAPVCSKPTGNTEQGLCDMSGNAGQWVQDWYHDSYAGAPAEGSAFNDPAGAARAVRGGSWFDVAPRARATSRNGADPASPFAYLSFRPAR